MLPLKAILCPTDLSPGSLCALATAAEWALTFDAELCLVHVLPPMEPVLGIVSDEEFNEARMEDAAQKVRETILGRVPSEVRTRVLVKIGSPAEEIIQAADEISADLIVSATHGETGWRHLVFGSVVEAVVRLAHQPVLTVHCPQMAPAERAEVAAGEMLTG